MIDIIKWHDASKERPKKSGDYLVKMNRPEWCRGMIPRLMNLAYSVVWDAFNCSDDDTIDRAATTVIENVGWWASLDDIETREEEVMSDEPI